MTMFLIVGLAQSSLLVILTNGKSVSRIWTRFATADCLLAFYTISANARIS